MASWKSLQSLCAVAVLSGACFMTSCADSKESMSSSFDMSEYRKMMERQKNEQAAMDSTETKTPEMTPEEHERAGDDSVPGRAA